MTLGLILVNTSFVSIGPHERSYWRLNRLQRKSFTACHSGKLKLTFTSPDVISTSPKAFWTAELISQFFCFSNSSKKITCPSGKLKTEFTSPIAKSTSPGLSDTTFFARCLMKIKSGQIELCSFYSKDVAPWYDLLFYTISTYTNSLRP